MMHEMAVYPWGGAFANDGHSLSTTSWHGASNPGKVYHENTIQNDPDKIAPFLLFVDGHAQQCDLTPILKANPAHGLEPGKDWMWYKPL